MYDRRVKTAIDVISRIRYVSIGLDYADMEARWRARFERYLNAPGHPEHELLGPDIILPTKRAAVADDYEFRARRFLMTSSGTELLNPNPDWVITVRNI